MNKFLITLAAMIIFLLSGSAFAYTETYSYSDYGEENSVENGSTYCSEKKGFLNKLRNTFVGQPTGYTPQIPSSNLINPYYGPSYQQGFYTGNRWNDHNVYSPQYPMRVYGLSF